MVNEAFSYIFGDWLIATIFCIGSGFYAGYGTWSNGWRTAWMFLFAVFSLGAITQTEAYYAVDRSFRVGHLSGKEADEFILTTVGFYWGSFLLTLWAGVAMLSAKDEELRGTAYNLKVEDVIAMIERTVSYPHIAVTPWATTVWAAMSYQDRANWVRRNIKEIRDIIAHYGGPDAIGVNDFIVELQQIERQ